MLSTIEAMPSQDGGILGTRAACLKTSRDPEYYREEIVEKGDVNEKW